MNHRTQVRRDSLRGRKFAAWVCFFLGIGLLVHGSLLPPAAGLEVRIVPAIVAFVFSLLFWGLVTVQNVVRLVALLKGREGELDKEERDDR